MVDHTAKLGVKVIALPEYAFFAESASSTPRKPPLLADQTAISSVGVSPPSRRNTACLIAAPIIERAAAGLYVTTVLVGPDGKEIGRYRKTHLTAEERKWAVAGFDYPVFETRSGASA